MVIDLFDSSVQKEIFLRLLQGENTQLGGVMSIKQLLRDFTLRYQRHLTDKNHRQCYQCKDSSGASTKQAEGLFYKLKL